MPVGRQAATFAALVSYRWWVCPPRRLKDSLRLPGTETGCGDGSHWLRAKQERAESSRTRPFARPLFACVPGHWVRPARRPAVRPPQAPLGRHAERRRCEVVACTHSPARSSEEGWHPLFADVPPECDVARSAYESRTQTPQLEKLRCYSAAVGKLDRRVDAEIGVRRVTLGMKQVERVAVAHADA
jgi:hypothetical protein